MASTTFVDGETLIEATWLNDVNAAVYTPGTTTAADIANVPAGNIAATDVQAAINELDTEKQPLDALLISLAGQTTAAGRIQGYSGVDTAMLYTVGTATGNVPLVGTKSATDALAGLVELSTAAEAPDRTKDAVVLTPATLRDALVAQNDAPIYACRAWINFDGGSVAIGTGRASGNVSSVTDNGTGDYTINFATAMPDADYAVVWNATFATGTHAAVGIVKLQTASAFRFTTVNGAGTSADSTQIYVAVFR